MYVQNIDFQSTILSRFDLIFIVRDEHNESRDQVCHAGTVTDSIDDCQTRVASPHEHGDDARTWSSG